MPAKNTNINNNRQQRPNSNNNGGNNLILLINTKKNISNNIIKNISSSNVGSNNNNINKKIGKKKIMENIKKDVDKGLEYLRTHSDILDATVSLIDMKIKRNELRISNVKMSSISVVTPPTTASTTTITPKMTTTTFIPTTTISMMSDRILRKLISEQQLLFPSNTNKLETKNHKIDNKKNDLNNILLDDEDNSNNNDDDFQKDETFLDTDLSQIEGGDSIIEKPLPPNQDIDDSNIDDNSLDEFSFVLNDLEDIDGGTNSVYQMEEIDLVDLDEVSRENRRNLMKGRDVVTTFLRIVESQHLLGANCTAGTALNLGEGVVDRYAQDRFSVEAEIAVNRANMLTR